MWGSTPVVDDVALDLISNSLIPRGERFDQHGNACHIVTCKDGRATSAAKFSYETAQASVTILRAMGGDCRVNTVTFDRTLQRSTNLWTIAAPTYVTPKFKPRTGTAQSNTNVCAATGRHRIGCVPRPTLPCGSSVLWRALNVLRTLDFLEY